jgi:hypothetical protein
MGERNTSIYSNIGNAGILTLLQPIVLYGLEDVFNRGKYKGGYEGNRDPRLVLLPYISPSRRPPEKICG